MTYRVVPSNDCAFALSVIIVSAASAVALTMIGIADSCAFSATTVLHMSFYG